ncbi:MAG: BMP family ABC transporter substrate-binding protein [Chloroflexi bacterium]|nr:BMP family ABC transporter substrate-binding protein [Chloroflexota bacterium]
MNTRFAEKVLRLVFVFVFVVGTAGVPTTRAGASPLAQGNGLHAEYRNLGGTEVILTVHGEGPINHGWNGSCPDTNMYQNECGSWAGMFHSWSLLEETLTGYIEAPATGTYEFHAWIDDYLQITINGVTQTADDLGGAGYSIVMDLVEGQFYPVTMEYKNRMGSANVGLYWTKPDATSQYVPKQYLYTEIPVQAPVITEGASVSVSMSKNGTPKPFNLTLNATDVNMGDVLTWSVSSPATNGTANASGTGTSVTVGYTPNTDYTGSDSFVVQVDDGNGGTDSVTVNVTIGAVTLYVPDDYSTIQAAVDAANPSDTVFVRAGTYYEHVVINKSLILQGEDKTTTIIDGSGSGYGIHMPSTDNVSISDFTVRNTQYGIFFTSGATYNTVSDVIATDSVHGINNHDQNNSNNTFQNVEVYGNSNIGIVAYLGSNNLNILDSNIHDNGASGVQIGWSSNWVVSGNTITGNIGPGISLDTASHGTITNNTMMNNSTGISFSGWGPEYNNVTSNVIRNNTIGLDFSCDARYNTVTENEISGSAKGVVISRNDACPNYANTFHHNTFKNNTIHAQDDEERYGGNTWDNGYPSGGNSWDTYTGLDMFHGAAQDIPGSDGIGDTAYVIRAGLDVDRYPLYAPVKVGLVTDVGGTADNGWNWLANQGLLQAETELGIDGTLYEPASSDEYATLIQQCVSDGNKLCIGASFLLADDLVAAANANPDVKFVIIDYSPENPPANLRGISFDAKQAGYLAGALAGKMTGSNKVGVVGGMEIPPVVAFAEGYRNGAQCANSNANVTINYTGSFNDPILGETTAQTMIADGADVIFAAAGETGNGAILYSSQHEVWSIGVDTDQYISVFGNGTVDGSDKLLTSAMKNLDFGVKQTISDYLHGNFSSGTVTYYLADGGVGLAPYHETDDDVPADVKSYVDGVKAGIIGGSINIDDSCRADPWAVVAEWLWGPFNMDFDGAGNLYVANEGSEGGGDKVSKITPEGVISTFSTGYAGAAGVDFNANGVLYVSDDTNRVFFLDEFGNRTVFVDSTANLSNPNAIAIDAQNNLYAVSAGGFVSKFASDGSLIELYLADGLDTPQGIVIDDQLGKIYVSDAGGNVYQIDMNMVGKTLYAQTNTHTGGGLARDADGNIYLSAWDQGVVYRIDALTQQTTVCLSGLNTPRGLAVGPTGRLYVTEYYIGRILSASGCTDEPAPGYQLHPSFNIWDLNQVHGYGWPNTQITLTIDDPVTQQSPDYTVTQPTGPTDWDPSGHSVRFFVTPNFMMQSGHIVTLAGGSYTRSHTITEVTASSISADTNIVTGTAAAGSDVRIENKWDSSIWRHEVAAPDGSWTADFNTTGDEAGETIADIKPGEEYHVGQSDEDGDGTWWYLRLPNPSFSARKNENQVHGYEWPLGSSVTLTIDDPDNGVGTDYTDTQTVVVADWDPNQTFVRFDLGAFILESGQLVSMSQGGTTKTHTVTNLTVTAVDPALDTVSGTAVPGSQVDVGHIYCDQNGCTGFRRVTADTNGNWIADFAHVGEDNDEQDIIDIKVGTGSEARQCDEDGECTTYGWHVPNPSIGVRANDDRIEGWEWTLGSTITVSVDDPVTPTSPDITRTAVVYEASWNPGEYRFDVDLRNIYDVKTGDTVTATDGTTTKTHTVTSLAFTDVNMDTDVVTGVAAAGSTVAIWACDSFNCYNYAPDPVADGDGVWSVDFTPIFDITYGTWIDSSQNDEDGDGTFFGKNMPNPRINVRANDNNIEGQEWTLGSTVTVTVDDPLTPVSPDITRTAVVYEASWNPGEYRFEIKLEGEFDIKASDIVTATDGTITKTHTVTSLAFTSIDVDTDVVTGTAQAGSNVDIWACDNNNCYNGPTVTADGNGNWSVDFTGIYDIVHGTWVDSSQNDEDGDGTYYGQHVPNPRINARLNENAVEGYEFQGDTNVTLQIDDPNTPEPVDYTASQYAYYTGSLYNTSLRFDLGEDFTLASGQTITMTDGFTTRTLIVDTLDVTGWNVPADTISGTAPASADIWFDLWADTGTLTRHFTADAGGGWTADYSAFGDENFEQNKYDVVNGTSGEVRIDDADGDSTSVTWTVYTPWLAPDTVPLVVGITRDVKLAQPQYTLEDWSVFNLLYEPLYRVSQADSSLIPAAATGYTISPDSKVFTFTLRNDMLWSDGQPVTAQHYADGLLWLLDPATSPIEYGMAYASLLYDIQGAEAYNNGSVTDPNTVGITAPNNTTLQITLARPAVHLPHILSIPGMIPIRKDLITLHGSEWVAPANFVGNGPFKLLEHDGTHFLFGKNTNYYNAAQVDFPQMAMPIIPDTNEQFEAYKRGEVDTVIDAPQSALDDANYTPERVYSALPGFHDIELNVQRTPTDNPLVRKALASAIDRRALLDTVLNTPWRQTATGIIPPEFPGYQGNAVGYEYNLTVAQSLLTQAGYPGGTDLPTIHLYARNTMQIPVIDAIADQWRTGLGVAVETHYRPDFGSWISGCEENPEACEYNGYRLGWIVDYYDAHNILYDRFNPDATWTKRIGWDNARYRELLDLIRAEQDPAQRLAYVQEAEQILVEEDAAVIPLYYYDRVSLVKPGLSTVFGIVPYYEQWNLAPVAINDVYSTNKNTTLNVPAETGILANDTDVDPITAVKLTDPAHGALALNLDGSFTYTPNTNFVGNDSFTYQASDGILTSNIATVAIQVGTGTPPPMPSSFYGEIHFSDNPPEEGDIVEAYLPIGTTPAATAVIGNYQGMLIYGIDVPGEITSEGSTITFKVNGRVVATAVWHSGTNVRLDFHPPQVLPGGPYSGDEGNTISFVASATDAGDDADTYQWDWDNDGAYDETGNPLTHTWADNGTYTVGLKVIDVQGGEGSTVFTVTVNNISPTANLVNNSPTNEGSPATVTFAGQTDPSGADENAGFHYAFACDGGPLADATYENSSTDASTTCTFDDGPSSHVVRARIIDQDDGFTEYTTEVIVDNIAPTATFNVTAIVDEGGEVTVSLTDPIDASTADLTAGFWYAFDCGVGYGGWGAANTTSCPTTDNGLLTVKGKIRDKDFAETEYTASVTVNDVLPASVSAGGPYIAVAGQSIAVTGSAVCASVDTCTYAWDLDNDGLYDEAVGMSVSHVWNTVGDYVIGLRVTDDDGNPVTATADVHVTPFMHNISLVPGWNLISFNVHPTDTAIASVLASVEDSFDLVYAWDATGAHPGSGNWLKYDNVPFSPDTLTALDETVGFWIHMTSTDVLEVAGSVPTTTNISLWDNAGGWNLVGYPSISDQSMPAVLSDHGVGTNFSLVYAYHANDILDPWKLYDRSAPVFLNDLTQLTPGWGYWINVATDLTWDVGYIAP